MLTKVDIFPVIAWLPLEDAPTGIKTERRESSKHILFLDLCIKLEFVFQSTKKG